MRFDKTNIQVTAILALISVGGITNATESGEFSAYTGSVVQVAPWVSKQINRVTGNTRELNAKNENSPEQCFDCIPSEKYSDKSSLPVTHSLTFAATADPQINKNTTHPRVSFQNDIARYLLAKLYNDERYKGLIIAGDLTEHTYKWEILRLYNSLLGRDDSDLSPILDSSKQLNRLYEGLGNHDMRKGTCCVGEGLGDNCVCESGLTDIISRGDRQDQVRSQSPHYSWEWDGIRFVQLNLLPGDEAETVWNGSGRDPQDALTFLKDELEDAGPDKNVIVVHHYGMDRFSNKWWSTETKNAYERVIRDYRVVAIITGHLHWTRRPSAMQQCWNGITAVTVGSLRLGFNLDFDIVNNHLTVTRLRNGSPRWSDSYSIAESETNFCGSNT